MEAVKLGSKGRTKKTLRNSDAENLESRGSGACSRGGNAGNGFEMIGKEAHRSHGEKSE